MKQTKTVLFPLVLVLALIVLAGASCGKSENANTSSTANVNKTSNVNSASNTNTAVIIVEKTTVTLNKSSYQIDEDVKATYKVVEPLKEGAWIGIIPASVTHGLESDGDANDVDWEYLNGSTSGTITLTAPATAGSYDVRIYDTEDEDGVELGYASFKVVGDSDEVSQLELSQTSYAPGEAITLTVTQGTDLRSNAWVGIIPSDVEHGSEEVNDENDIDWRYLDSGENVLTFAAPDEPGDYDFRLNDSDTTGAVELTYVSFTVTSQQ